MLKLTLLLLLFTCLHAHQCIHDQFIKNTTIHFYDDLTDHRMLQAPVIGPLRTYFDYSQVVIGQQRDRIMVKQAMQVAASFFYNTLTVPRLQALYYPSDIPLKCKIFLIKAIFLIFLQNMSLKDLLLMWLLLWVHKIYLQLPMLPNLLHAPTLNQIIGQFGA